MPPESRTKRERAAIEISRLLTPLVVAGRVTRGFGTLKSKLSFIGRAGEPELDLAALGGGQRHCHFSESRRPCSQRVRSCRNLYWREPAAGVRRSAANLIDPHDGVRFSENGERARATNRAGLLLCLCALVPRTKVATQATVKIDSAFALAGKTTLFSLVMIGTFTARRKAGASERALLFFDERRL